MLQVGEEKASLTPLFFLLLFLAALFFSKMASQDCPLCFSKGVFSTWNCLKDSLVSLSTRSFTCPLCFCVLEGLDKFSLHLVSHEMEAKKLQQQQVHHLHQHPRSSALQTEDAVPTISIKEGSSNIDTLDDLLADFSEFVKQEDKICYDHHQLQPKPPPNPILQEAPPLPIEPSPKLQQVLDGEFLAKISYFANGIFVRYCLGDGGAARHGTVLCGTESCRVVAHHSQRN